MQIHKGDSLELLTADQGKWNLIATDPPYAYSGQGVHHALTATVAVVLREAARRLLPGGWMIVFAASSWRSQAYMVEAVRGILEPVRVGHWLKPKARTKVSTGGWQWASVAVIAMRKGKSKLPPSTELDWITREPVQNGRRAELPPEVAQWAVRPFAVAGGRMLDPFCGSGRLVEAADDWDMEAIGYDLDPLAPHAIDCDMDDDCCCAARDHSKA